RLRLVCGRRRALAHHDMHLMFCAVILQRNFISQLLPTIHYTARDTATYARRVLDFDAIARPTITVVDLIFAPPARDTWRKLQTLAAQTEAENEFQPRAIHPTGRACVPRPAAAPRVRPDRIDIGRRDVRLDLVLVQARARRGVIDRVEQREQFARMVAIAQERVGDQDPQRGVRVLAAVLAHARHVAFDVAGIERTLIKWRREEDDQTFAALDQILFDRSHRTVRAMRIGRAGDDAPTLRNRINAALFVLRRAERRAIVKVRAPVPIAVPRFGFERLFQLLDVRAIVFGALRIIARLANGRELRERRVEKPTDPDALALAPVPDAVHAVVPIARTHQRQSMRARLQTPIKRARAVFVQRGCLSRNCWLRVRLVFVLFQRRRFDERDYFIEHSAVAGDANVKADDVG